MIRFPLVVPNLLNIQWIRTFTCGLWNTAWCMKKEGVMCYCYRQNKSVTESRTAGGASLFEWFTESLGQCDWPFACSGTGLVPHWWHGDALLAIARRVAISETAVVAVELVIDGSLPLCVHHPIRILFSSTAQLRRTPRSDHLVERYAARSALLQLSTYVEPYDEDKRKQEQDQ